LIAAGIKRFRPGGGLQLWLLHPRLFPSRHTVHRVHPRATQALPPAGCASVPPGAATFFPRPSCRHQQYSFELAKPINSPSPLPLSYSGFPLGSEGSTSCVHHFRPAGSLPIQPPTWQSQIRCADFLGARRLKPSEPVPRPALPWCLLHHRLFQPGGVAA
jgi:hypothetical protein